MEPTIFTLIAQLFVIICVVKFIIYIMKHEKISENKSVSSKVNVDKWH